MGGWIAMVQYCSNGFSPCPSGMSVITPRPAHQTLKGLSTNAFIVRKKVCTVIRMPVTYGIRLRNFLRFWNTTTAEYVDSSQDHNISDPSMPPHQAVNL